MSSSKHIKMNSTPSVEAEEAEDCLGENYEGHSQNGDTIRFKKGGRLSRLTRLEKGLLVLLLVVIIVFVAVIITLSVKNDDDKKEIETCISPDCVNAAYSIHSKIDYTVDPCEDFYQFSCGKWMADRVIPEDRGSVNQFTDLRDDVEIILKNILEANINSSDTEYTKKAKTLYASCMNYDLINEHGVQPFIDLLMSEYGGWPLTTKSWDDATFNFTDMLIKLNMINFSPVLYFVVDVDFKNSSKRTFHMDQAGLGMPGQKYYQVNRNDSMLKAYENLMFDVGKVFGFANPATASQEVKDIVDFEINLAKILVPDEERRDNNLLYNPMTLEEISKSYSDILDWKKYVFTIMSSPGIDVGDVTEKEIIINWSPSYFEQLSTLLTKTPKRTLANYLIWRLVKNLIFTQGDVIQEPYSVYEKTLFGVKTKPPRYRTCVRYVTRNMGQAVGKLFIKDNFDRESKAVALDMIKDLHMAFDGILDNVDWMDEKTKKVAKEKNTLISPKIGYPDALTNETYLIQIYKNYTYSVDQYLGNTLVNLRENYKYMMRRLREPVDKNLTIFNPSDVNAYYSQLRNQITFPAGILQPPFFSKTFPNSMNYGGIGVVIGHEITHGFDDRGRQYDKLGNLVQWWSQSAIDNFKARSQCIIDQYSNYTVQGINMNVNGINTQGENIADNGGLKESYKAYRNKIQREGKEEKQLPGLSFNHNQLFFINFAQLWCELKRDASAINSIRSGVHSPGRFRVVGTIQNSEDFSNVFQCSKSSKMNPKTKCSVW